jgi:OCT family organic cation transporter-like MFS transporter 4/5
MRAIVGVMGAIDFSLGFMLWPVLAYYIRDDFLLQLAGTLPLLVAISFWW